jgi:hypothetical protein
MSLFQRYKRLNIWNKLGVIASVLTVITFVVWFAALLIPERPKPRPHFALSLQLGTSPEAKVLLTNDFLFTGRFVNAGNLPNGSFLFRGIPDGCIVIPVQSGESNEVFSFIAENDSPVKVNDLEIAVGFPKDCECGLDPTKWREIRQHITIPGEWRFDITNLQFWAAQSPYTLFPTDSLTFPPVTNYCIPEFNNPTNKNCFLNLGIRCTDFESLISANVIFVRISTNTFKPFIARMRQGTDGVWRVSMSPKELEDSQK